MVTAHKRVLVVDDEDVVCKSYERVLKGAGFEVAKAHSGQEALERIKERDYDVMLADLKMPGMDGLQVVERLRGTHPDLPVVVITGYPTRDTLEAAARLGVTDYLTKPVAPDMLTHVTMQALETGVWRESPPPYLATTIAPAAPQRTDAGAIPSSWPAQPTEVMVPESAEEVAAPEESPEPGAVRVAVRLVCAPFIGLAYVMFLPVAGFAVFFGLGAKALAKKLGAREA